ncbi:MAG: permease-like cell division protein FtsX [Clostridiales bacterium]|nr:permease-like cell division protein FtsX [Clostridiales bacterium]MCF8022892.1 permease-like cell division protein FtsX [Clostridiales bacterium]
MSLDNLTYYFREAFSSLHRNFWLSWASIGVIIISLLILGSSALVVINARCLADQIESSVEISVFAEEDISESELDELGDKLKLVNGVDSVEFVSSSEALEKLKESFGEKKEALDGLEERNTLPDSYQVKTVDTSLVSGVAENIEQMQGVEKVRYGHGVVEKLMKMTSWARMAGVVLVLLMSIAAVFLIATTIRMSIFSRQYEIEIMKYLGATNFFIRVPFFLEGMILGTAGGLVSVALLFLGYHGLVDKVNSAFSFLQLVGGGQLINYIFVGLVLLGAIIGAVGSSIPVKRFLKV